MLQKSIPFLKCLMLLTCLTEKVKWYILLKSTNIPSFHKHLMSEIFLSFCLCPSVQKIFLLIFQLSLLLFQRLLCKDQRWKGKFFCMRMYLSIYSLSYLMHSFTALLLFEREKISQKFFFMILKNLVGVCRGTSFKSSFVENLLGNQVTLWIHFLFLMNVLFIWYALWSQQTLSFRAGRILNFFLDPPTY